MDETCTTNAGGYPCGEKATCRYGWHHGDNQRACDAHDPLRPPHGIVGNYPHGFWYETIYRPPVPGTTVPAS